MELKTLMETPPWEWPADTATRLLNALRDETTTEEDRLLAAELAGDFTVINDDLVGVLLSILHDHTASQELRGQAALSLGPALEYADTQGFEDEDDAPISEQTFDSIQRALHTLYGDAGVPDGVRRRILEASVRAPQDWHKDAVRAAYASDDEEWKLTAVFSMVWIRGFKAQILEALKNPNQQIRLHAVQAAGNWELDAAWSDVKGIVQSSNPDKDLLVAAIGALASIRPKRAMALLASLADSDDEDIAEAVQEAMAMAEGLSGFEE